MFHVKHRPIPAGVSRETAERLTVFVELLQRWNSKINLVSRRDADELWDRHVEDSLQLLPLIPPGIRSAIDLGSGGGFPGIILSIAGNIQFSLIESDARKAAFLREAGRATSAPVSVHAERIEHCRLPRTQLVTSRALAPLSALLAYAEPFLAPDAFCLFPKGASVEQELTDAASNWNMIVERHPSMTDPSGTILRLHGIRRG